MKSGSQNVESEIWVTLNALGQAAKRIRSPFILTPLRIKIYSSYFRIKSKLTSFRKLPPITPNTFQAEINPYPLEFYHLNICSDSQLKACHFRAGIMRLCLLALFSSLFTLGVLASLLVDFWDRPHIGWGSGRQKRESDDGNNVGLLTQNHTPDPQTNPPSLSMSPSPWPRMRNLTALSSPLLSEGPDSRCPALQIPTFDIRIIEC